MSKRKLLLADDSVTIQKVVNLTFADEGIEVISVGDGDSAMEKVAEMSPDLIMADVNMPGLTGYEICERIRQDDKLRRTPVILLVGSFEPFDEDEARRVGADDYLTKPFQSIRQLVNKVTVLLNSQSNENGDRAEMKDSSSLEDTLEMDAGEISVPSQSAQFSDTGYDDEMIQTNRPSSFAFDETQKFETRETEELIIPQSTLPQENTEEDLLEDYASATEESAQETIEVAERVSDDLETDISDDIKESEITNYGSDEIKETEIVDYEIKDEVAKSPEIESDGFSYQMESNSGTAYQMKEEEAVFGEVEVSEDISSPNISYEIKDEESVLEEVEEYEETVEESVSDKIEENEIISAEANDYQIVSDEIEGEENISTEFTESKIENEVEFNSENDEVELAQTTHEEEMPLPEFASVLESDEDDILQLPPIESDIEDEEEDEVAEETFETATTATTPAQTASFVSTEQKTSPADFSTISPELIEVIVAKVLERLSDKAVKEVAWEVVPQMTEIIVRKMAEEKLRE